MEANRKAPRAKPGVRRGYEKLAFGKVNDAVRLMFPDGLTPAEIKKLDLFGVSELRQTKDGLEIRFYDRLKALECLHALEGEESEKSPLYRALVESVGKTERAAEHGD